jgi:hypothetical protein
MKPSKVLTPLLVAVAAALIAACAAPLPSAAPPGTPPLRHEAPTSGPSARLLTRAAVGTGDVFGLFVLDDSIACTGLRAAAAGNAARQAAATALVAERMTTLDFRIVRADKRSCMARWTFTPGAGRSYLVAGAATATGCNMRLLDATDPDAIKPVTQALVRNATGKPCLSLDDARAARDRQPVGGQSGGDAVLMPGAGTNELEGLLK